MSGAKGVLAETVKWRDDIRNHARVGRIALRRKFGRYDRIWLPELSF